MVHTIYSRRRDELPEIIEEKLSPLTAGILLMADGAKRSNRFLTSYEGNILEDLEFRSAINFLTSQERQLIKFTPGFKIWTSLFRSSIYCREIFIIPIERTSRVLTAQAKPSSTSMYTTLRMRVGSLI